MVKLVFARHGESEWNKANLFTGWADVDLSEKGTQQAIDAGKLIKEAGIEFDQAYTSVLKRAIKTTNLALEASDQLWVPVEKSWRLNERHYGGLTGKNKAEAAEQFGDEQVHIWRRSYDVLPPAMDRDDEHSAHTDRRYASLDDSVIPDAENLKVTLERALPFWEDKIAPALKDGKNVFVGAHGNSIRALVKHIKQLSDDEIMDVEIPNFPPLVFVTKIENASGDIIATHSKKSKRVISQSVANQMTSMMLGTFSNGSAVNANYTGYTMAGKTGTVQAEFNKDLTSDQWVIGYTPDVVMTTWIGFDKTDESHYLTGASSGTASTIFSYIAADVLPNTPGTEFTVENAYAADGQTLDYTADPNDSRNSSNKSWTDKASDVVNDVKDQASSLWDKITDSFSGLFR